MKSDESVINGNLIGNEEAMMKQFVPRSETFYFLIVSHPDLKNKSYVSRNSSSSGGGGGQEPPHPEFCPQWLHLRFQNCELLSNVS